MKEATRPCRQAERVMKFVRRHWYSLGLAFGAVAVAWAFLGNLSTVQGILLLNFAVLTLHQFEEYAWPGGEPWIINDVMQPKGGPRDRYPLNQNNAFFMNVPLAWMFYLLPVFRRQWYGSAWHDLVRVWAVLSSRCRQ